MKEKKGLDVGFGQLTKVNVKKRIIKENTTWFI